MLSLIPAVLILILHGPSGVDRVPVDGKISQALRVWAIRQAGLESCAEAPIGEQGRGELGALLSLGKDSPEFSRFIAQVLQITASLAPKLDGPPPPDSGRAAALCRSNSSRELRKGLFASRRTRDGPRMA
jgi:hypothetical protein